MSSSSKFSLILMHDDGRTHRLRLGKTLCYCLATVALLSPLFGGVGIWLGWQAWVTREAMTAEFQALHAELTETQIELERCANMEALRRLPDNGREAAPEGAPGHVAAPAALASAAQAAAGAPAAPPDADAIPLPPGEGAGEADPTRMAVDTGAARVENVSARLMDPRHLRVSVDLYNAGARGPQLAGKVVFSLLPPDGQLTRLPVEDASFRINRFKKIVSTVALPSALTDTDNTALMVEVLVDDTPVFRKLYPVDAR